ncbi:nucleotidyltransferase domain-containing protein [Clavibacter lycopersici]|uniref:Nucleotidyltransferase domain-containing protein n=1 Tax=Clavibacter lycopersici TaxID=2301718 RepID=A0A399TD58_9MICO|nr:nucleotidyltransferase domain-containing protein [Clavibacter lycopersici]RIJ53418.1 nucleotidyltransferase domain-containing protein [Clavibacter lycopersici]RIJ55936.1 nucleotidyltransferase domain-containing protein [Clavibacter lycopersici]
MTHAPEGGPVLGLDDDAFLEHVADTLASVPGVRGVALGGSRAQGANRPESDWDVAVYYRGDFDPDGLRALGWPGQLSPRGGWGRIFDGGGALHVDGRAVDVHYRDLDAIEAVHEEALAGRFTLETLLFHQAGLPSTILLAEVGVNRALRGEVPVFEYPRALRASAPGIWWQRAELTLHYAREGHARHGRAAQCGGLLSEAACQAAHAILAHRGEWITNEKRLLTRAGLRGVDQVVGHVGTGPAELLRAVDAVEALLLDAVRREGIPVGD